MRSTEQKRVCEKEQELRRPVRARRSRSRLGAMSFNRGWRVGPAPPQRVAHPTFVSGSGSASGSSAVDVKSMLAQHELLGFWQSLLRLRSSEEVGERLVSYAESAFENLQSVQLHALEEMPGNPRMLRACGGKQAGEKILLSKSALAQAITNNEPIDVAPSAPEYEGMLILPLYPEISATADGQQVVASPRSVASLHPTEADDARAAAAATAAALLAPRSTEMVTPMANGAGVAACGSEQATNGDRPIGLLVLTRRVEPAAPAPGRLRRERRSSERERRSSDIESDSKISLSASLLRRSSMSSVHSGNSGGRSEKLEESLGQSLGPAFEDDSAAAAAAARKLLGGSVDAAPSTCEMMVAFTAEALECNHVKGYDSPRTDHGEGGRASEPSVLWKRREQAEAGSTNSKASRGIVRV